MQRLANPSRPGLFLALLVSGLLAGCPTEPTTPENGEVAPLEVAEAVRYQLGGPLRGPLATGTPVSAEAASLPHVELLEASVLALAAPPPGWKLSALPGETKVVAFADGRGAVLHATPGGLATAFVGHLDGPRDAVVREVLSAGGRLLGTHRACLLEGATAVVEVTRDVPPERPEIDPAKRLRVAALFGRAAGSRAIDAGLELERASAPPEVVELAEPAFAGSGVPGSAAPGNGGSWVALVPSPFAGASTQDPAWIAFVADVAPSPVGAEPGAAATQELVSLAMRDLAAQAISGKMRTAPVPLAPAVPDLGPLGRALLDPPTARRSLYVLALSTGAKTAETLSILVDDATLAPIASAVATTIAQEAGASDPAALGMKVEKATIQGCRKLMTGDVVPEQLAVALETRGGEALRLLPTLWAEIDKPRTLAELERQLVLLNVDLLNDPSPMIRVHTARWLESRMDLAGYSPLMSAAQRRTTVAHLRRRLQEADHGS